MYTVQEKGQFTSYGIYKLLGGLCLVNFVFLNIVSARFLIFGLLVLTASNGIFLHIDAIVLVMDKIKEWSTEAHSGGNTSVHPHQFRIFGNGNQSKCQNSSEAVGE